MFVLINMLISIGINLVLGLIGGILHLSFIGNLGYLYSLAIIVPSIAVGVRRMHDTNHSGWWLHLPIVNLVFACTEGVRGPNEYGPDPKGM